MIRDKVKKKFFGKEISKKLGINYSNRKGLLLRTVSGGVSDFGSSLANLQAVGGWPQNIAVQSEIGPLWLRGLGERVFQRYSGLRIRA